MEFKTFLTDLPRRLVTRHSDKMLEAALAAGLERVFVTVIEHFPHVVRVAGSVTLLVTGCDVTSHH